VRYFDSRGIFQGVAVPSGSGPGQVDRPQGISVDPAGRLIVSDSGHDRLALYQSLAGGFVPLDFYGSTGTGTGQFSGPTYSALAPGALLYVADSGNGRIVRLRFDDADHDGAIDAVDNCPGLTNQDQRNHDGDASGNACDADDDNDGIADAQDPCPTTLPFKDANRDGCADPVSVARTPKRGRKLAASQVRISGRARADSVGVAKVAVALRRVRDGRCSWWSQRQGRFVRGACGQPKWVRAKGAKRWSLNVPKSALRRGSYSVRARATQRRTGVVERGSRTKTRFRIV
jgi:hypothetical protein